MSSTVRIAVLPMCFAALTSHAMEPLSESEMSDFTGQAGVTIDLEASVSIGQVQWNGNDPDGSLAFTTINSGGTSGANTPSGSQLSDSAGVTIEVEAKVSIGEVTWTDTDTGGSVHLGGVRLGGDGIVGGTGGEVLDNLKLTIDSDNYGNLIIGHTAVDEAGMLDGSNAIDIGLALDYVGISGANGYSELVSNVAVSANMGPGHIVVYNDGNNGVIKTQGYSEIVDGSAMLDVAGVGIKDLKIYQDSNPFASSTYEDESGNQVSKWSDYTDASQYGVDVDGDGSYETSWADYATNNGNDRWAFSAATIGTTPVNGGDQALWLRVDHSNVDISMTVGIGGGSYDNIGAINIQDLNTTGTRMTIYGH